MADFKYDESLFAEVRGFSFQQAQKAEEMASELRKVLAVVDAGAWIGQGSEAFQEELRQMINRTENVRALMENFFGKLRDVESRMSEVADECESIVQS